MIRWQYKTVSVSVEHWFSRHESGESMLGTELTGIGHSGWELVSAIGRHENGRTTEIMLIFKRPM